MKKLFLILLSTVMFLMSGCEETEKTDKDLNEPDSMYVEGPCLVCDNGKVMIIQDGKSPVVMNVADKSVFEGLTTGDLIKIECKYIMETYPGQTTVLDLEFISDGSVDDISEDLLLNLADMGWVAVTE